VYTTTNAIVLGAVKYGESSRVLRCYTDVFGLQSYMINSVKSKNAVLKPSMLLPLTQLEIVAGHKGKGTLERIKEARVFSAYETIPFDPYKNAMALFLAEVLAKCLQEEQPNEDKFEYVVGACNLLDSTTKLSPHFHISFLLGLSRFLGFYPDQQSAASGDFFDLMHGVFLPTQPLHAHFADLETSSALKIMLQTNLGKTDVEMPKRLRKKLLNEILFYYKLHVDGFGNLKSVAVIDEIFS
jgi:DNA repair protein RecO (recombination protein O)